MCGLNCDGADTRIIRYETNLEFLSTSSGTLDTDSTCKKLSVNTELDSCVVSNYMDGDGGEAIQIQVTGKVWVDLAKSYLLP